MLMILLHKSKLRVLIHSVHMYIYNKIYLYNRLLVDIYWYLYSVQFIDFNNAIQVDDIDTIHKLL